MVFNVSWLTSVICWTGRVAARCTGFPNYCSLRRVQQIYGQWEESSIPTITPSARIKLTICNLNRLNTRASREKHNQPGRGPEEINSKTLWLASSSLYLFFVFLLSPGPPIFFTFSYRSNPIFSNSLALAYTHGFVSHQWPPLRLSLQHTDILLGRDFHYLRSGTIYQGMSSSHPVWLTEGSSFYWILRSPFFFPHRSILKWDRRQVWADVHTVVHVLLHVSMVTSVCSCDKSYSCVFKPDLTNHVDIAVNSIDKQILLMNSLYK